MNTEKELEDHVESVLLLQKKYEGKYWDIILKEFNEHIVKYQIVGNQVGHIYTCWRNKYKKNYTSIKEVLIDFMFLEMPEYYNGRYYPRDL